jgi:hypothetical protein
MADQTDIEKKDTYEYVSHGPPLTLTQKCQQVKAAIGCHVDPDHFDHSKFPLKQATKDEAAPVDITSLLIGPEGCGKTMMLSMMQSQTTIPPLPTFMLLSHTTANDSFVIAKPANNNSQQHQQQQQKLEKLSRKSQRKQNRKK